jgi:hypothetical protein
MYAVARKDYAVIVTLLEVWTHSAQSERVVIEIYPRETLTVAHASASGRRTAGLKLHSPDTREVVIEKLKCLDDYSTAFRTQEVLHVLHVSIQIVH